MYRKLFSIEQVCLMTFLSLTCLVHAQEKIDDVREDTPDASLILYLSFDELNGNQAIDHSRYGNHGTLVGNPRLVQGKFGNALEFNGQSDWVEVPHDESLTVDTGVTVMAWIHTPRHRGPGGALWQGILAKGNNPRSYSFYTEHNGSLHLSVNDFYGSDSAEKVTLNEWQHVVAQVDNGVHRYWINGRNVGVLRYTRDDRNIGENTVRLLPGNADTASVLIGNTHDIAPASASNRHFLGRIDEVRIWNRPLSEAEILEQIKIGFAPTNVVPVSTTSEVASVSLSTGQSPVLGEQLVFNINITGGKNVTGYQLTLHFDSTALRYISSNNAGYLPAETFVIPPLVSENQVTLAATSLNGESQGDGTLATVTFEVIALKPSTLRFSQMRLVDRDGSTLAVSVKNAEVIRLPTDVNSDGVVNIQDLVLVASNFGKVGHNVADVNGDGIVNIADLVKVAGTMGNVAAAPSTGDKSSYSELQALEILTATDVQTWLTQAQYLNLTGAMSQRGILFLEQLLAALIPKETALLPNYPNPFNPETWIPYQLAEAANVTVSIYSADGKLVQTLELGQLPAGIYESRSRAAYWDGRNHLGESIASGVYFYTLSAGEFTLTRKMLIRK